jgi:hypothetical protein
MRIAISDNSALGRTLLNVNYLYLSFDVLTSYQSPVQLLQSYRNFDSFHCVLMGHCLEHYYDTWDNDWTVLSEENLNDSFPLL